MPSDVQPLLITGDDNICDALKKFLQVAILIAQYHAYKYDSDGNFTPAFEAEICSSPCFNPPEEDDEEDEEAEEEETT